MTLAKTICTHGSKAQLLHIIAKFIHLFMPGHLSKEVHFVFSGFFKYLGYKQLPRQLPWKALPSTLYQYSQFRHGSTTNPSLVPRPYPLTRRNGLVNQVHFLGLAGALATV